MAENGRNRGPGPKTLWTPCRSPKWPFLGFLAPYGAVDFWAQKGPNFPKIDPPPGPPGTPLGPSNLGSRPQNGSTLLLQQTYTKYLKITKKSHIRDKIYQRSPKIWKKGKKRPKKADFGPFSRILDGGGSGVKKGPFWAPFFHGAI